MNPLEEKTVIGQPREVENRAVFVGKFVVTLVHAVAASLHPETWTAKNNQDKEPGFNMKFLLEHEI